MSQIRLRLDLAYDGTDFSGWAAQPDRRTVEGELTRALRQVTRSEALSLTVAGRTDAGVHARGQVAHVDVPLAAYAALPARSGGEPWAVLTRRLAGVLPPDLVVHAVTEAADGFDARFSAIWRRYEYRIADDRARRDPLRRQDTVLVRGELDAGAMSEAAQSLLGLQDFAAFCKRRDGATAVRTLLEYHWERRTDGVLVGTVRADAFCHSMVRALVGVLVPVGRGEREASFAAEVLRGGIRDSRVKVMPAHGLSLEEVGYPDDDGLSERARQARARRVLPGD